ncbi:hypothetical protein FSP39_017361 [Pinctada imbricata]|uniref:Kinesin-like protein n=1 Tax=Pinctada imbricata TaxID=66713 RepID=A0AA89C7Y2_PINIB|nr:hypothetical protein FSP39_017361 [Pinctada imbricata]
MEGQAGIWTVKNLSVHYAATEEVAQNLLLQGQANRRVAATAVHDRSSRSHAVLTIQLTSKKPGSDVLVRSKLHLVDLAGSERVSKTGAHGNLLNEAKCINLSLHYLESVIIALQGEKAPPSRRQQHSAGPPRGPNSLDKKRPHSADPTPRVTKYVPYRNSLLTMVLRDSLGGNCMTCMIATISLEYLNLGETLSTCRFAGRVACIANSVSRNEEVDEKSLVKKLRKRVAELETELACLLMEKEETNFTLELMNTKLTDEDKLECNKIIEKYVEGKVNDPVSEGITNPYKFRECMKILKKMVVDGVFRNPANQNPDGTVNIDVDHYNSPMIGSEINAKRRRSLDETGDDRKRSHVDNTQCNQSTSVQGHKSRPRHKETAVTIPITNAWGEDTYQSEPEQPIRRPRHRQRRRQNPPLTDPDTDKEEDKKKFDELRLVRNVGTNNRRRRHYKSPFEKKRIKEIKKLNEKVENMQQTQIDKEGELVQMKLNLAEQELNIMEEQIKTKLSVTEDQLADQQAYVQQLKADEADVQLIQKERMVEKQLRKKQEKANRKIEAIDEKRKQLHQHSEDVQNEISKAKPTLKDQYGKYRNRDGSLNTRQVFDMLRTEEKKQEKIQNQMEHERMLMLSQHLEMKEAATRQKLREFKDMLRMSHSAGFPEGHGGGENGYLRSITAPDYAEPVRSKAREENNTEEPSARSAIAGESRLTEKPLAESSRPVSRQSVKSTKSIIPDSEFYAKKRQEKDPTVRWESPYSRPSTACSNVPPNIEVIKSVNGDDPEFGYGMTDDYKSTRASKRSARSELMPMDDEADDEMDVYETMMPSEYVYGMTPKDKFDGRKMGLASTTFDMALKQMLESQDQEMYPDHDGY